MKKRLAVFLGLMLFAGVAAGCGGPAGKNDTYLLPDGYKELAVGRAMENATDGIGVEFDPHFLSQNISKGAAKEDWEIVRRRTKELKIQKFRVQVLPEWFEPLNDNDDPDTVNWENITKETEEMKSLYAVLDLAEEIGAHVNITLWGVSKTVKLIPGTLSGEFKNPFAAEANGKKHFLGEGNNSDKNWIMGVAEEMEEEWAESFSILVQILKKDKNYSCVKEITPVNEPSWAYYVQNAQNPKDEADWDGYVRMCKKLDAKFKADQIRDLVLFNLSDDAENYDFLAKSVEELGEIADLFNSHNYKFNHDTPNQNMTEWEDRNAAQTARLGKPHFIGEFGSNQNRNTSTRQYDVYTYERGVFLVRSMLNYFNAGAVGMSYWVLFDQYYNRGASYNEFMQLGLWCHKKDTYVSEPELPAPETDYQIRPQYYAYGLMANHVSRGSKIYPLRTGDELIAASAFLRGDGKWVYVLANSSDADKKFAFRNEFYGEFDVYAYAEDALPAGEAMIAATDTAAFENQCMPVTSKAHGVLVLVQK
jgi:alpha-galactosidase